MRLHAYVLQMLMVSIYSALVTMQILATFHTSLEDGHKLPVRNMVSSFCGGEFLAEEHHRALLLQQPSTQTHHRCITCIWNALLKSGSFSTGAEVNLEFSCSKARYCCSPHTKDPLTNNGSLIGTEIVMKCDIK